MKRVAWLLAVCALAGSVGALSLLAWRGSIPRPDAAASAPTGRAAFDQWLGAVPGRPQEFADFEAFIVREELAGPVPVWTLLRANATKSAQCNADAFVLPPRHLWPNILPALRLVRDRVVPAIGKVAVASAFRDPALNACSRGAGRSRHMGFHALDLVPLAQADVPAGFAKLCAAWRASGGGSRWGLGAYYDAARPAQNRVGRFHVDGTGWRTWGFDYRRASSGCNIV